MLTQTYNIVNKKIIKKVIKVIKKVIKVIKKVPSLQKLLFCFQYINIGTDYV